MEFYNIQSTSTLSASVEEVEGLLMGTFMEQLIGKTSADSLLIDRLTNAAFTLGAPFIGSPAIIENAKRKSDDDDAEDGDGDDFDDDFDDDFEDDYDEEDFEDDLDEDFDDDIDFDDEDINFDDDIEEEDFEDDFSGGWNDNY